ncbi:conserved hypothetical protein [Cupriavidus necator]|uniref:DUF6708 domain-containing protein n=2 Tax=Cupriavidus necator TaxID=106590 RepID=A0A1K0J2K0_CUPNE|nr:conserved hypothetical protein [Cupriavidus necator]
MWVEEAINDGMNTGDFYLEPDEVVTGGMPHDRRAADRVMSNCSVYQKNETFLEVCGQFEAQRGLLGFALGAIPFAMLAFFGYMSSFPIQDWIRGTTPDGLAYGWDHDIAGIFLISMFLFLFWLAKWLVLPQLRKDYFTSRRILIRFNRITRKVYLHTPPFAGGIKTFDWDSTQATLDNKAALSPEPVSEEEANSGSGRLIMGWLDMEARKGLGLIFVGRPAGNAARGRAWWEYIRRYMEEGPDSVPQPFPRLWKGAWPQYSLLNMFYLYPERLIHGGPLWWLILPALAPFDLLRAILHWIAMLLCVEPKFPPEIENAGRVEG